MRTVEFERAMAELAEKEVLLRRIVKRRETERAVHRDGTEFVAASAKPPGMRSLGVDGIIDLLFIP